MISFIYGIQKTKRNKQKQTDTENTLLVNRLERSWGEADETEVQARLRGTNFQL